MLAAKLLISGLLRTCQRSIRNLRRWRDDDEKIRSDCRARLDRLADQKRETAIVIGGNRSVTPARPHIIGAARTARRCSLMLRGSMAESDRAMHAAAEIDGVVETLREWADALPNRRLDAIRANSCSVMARFVAANAQELRA